MARRRLYFKFGPWMQLSLRFFRVNPIFSDKRRATHIYYFPVQNVITGIPYLIGFKGSFLKEFAKVVEERNYTDQTITHYKFLLWNKPFVNYIDKRWYFRPVIREIKRLTKHEYGRLEGIRKDIDADRREYKIVESGDKYVYTNVVSGKLQGKNIKSG